MHKTLERQLVKFLGSLEKAPKELKGLFEQISKTYTGSDQEYILMERALDISSKELTKANIFLREEKTEIEKRVEERTKELSQERRKLDRIAQNMDTGAILLDKEGAVIFINNKAMEMINFTGKDNSKVLHYLFEKFKEYPIKENLQKCISGDNVEMSEVQIYNNIYEILFQKLMENVKGSNESFGHLIWIRDITTEKLLERSKSELVAVASHQLRTPLTVTKGNTEMLLDESFGKLNDEQKKIISDTHESNEKLITLVNQMLDITRIERSILPFTLEEVHVDEILKKAIDDLAAYASSSGVIINYIKPEHDIPKLNADKERIYQVLQNLIENSIKYCLPDNTKQCKVDISLQSTKDVVDIEITDNGIGIPKSEQSRIFERFYRASNVTAQAGSGTGLGLYIVKSIVEHFGGKIRFDSEENKGTTFYITLPLAKKLKIKV